MTATSTHPLDPIFHPRAVAVVGVSSRQTGFAPSFLGALMEQGYHERHPLYPVNPKMEEIEGLRCYPSLLDTPEPVDHVISLVPAAVAPTLVDQCIEKGVRSIHFFTAGLSETGDPELTRVEHDMIARLRAAGIRAIGPNCMGLYVPESGLAFMSGFPSEPGHVMLISQSGANAGEVIGGLARRGVRFSKAVSYGNAADVSAEELFEYAATDPETHVVTAYIEGVRDGRTFFDAVGRCAAVKPTIILKGGLTGAGARAAHSHTGSLAGSREIFEALCRQTGAIRAETMDDLHDLVVAVSTSARRIRGRGVALVGGGGGIAVLAADALAMAGLEVPPMPESAKESLREFIPVAGTSVNNPIDTNMGTPELMERTLRIVAAADPIDVVFTSPLFGRPAIARPSVAAADPLVQDDPSALEEEREQVEAARRTADQMRQLQEETGKPFVGLLRDRWMTAASAEAFQEACMRQGVAVFPGVHRAARALRLVLEWRARRAGLPEIL